jgi:hypothetical protein
MRPHYIMQPHPRANRAGFVPQSTLLSPIPRLNPFPSTSSELVLSLPKEQAFPQSPVESVA